MKTKQKLTKRQLAVVDELFRGELGEQAILDKYKVSRSRYNIWLSDEDFAGEFDRRIESAFRQSALLIARYVPLAAAKLVSLMDSSKEETARKACLDILQTQSQRLLSPEPRPQTPALPLTDQAASRLLAALAEQADAE